MSKELIVILAIVWYAIGVLSFINWWTEDYDFKVNNIPVAMFVGIAGPISYIIGSALHGDDRSKVLIKKKEQ